MPPDHPGYLRSFLKTSPLRREGQPHDLYLILKVDLRGEAGMGSGLRLWRAYVCKRKMLGPVNEVAGPLGNDLIDIDGDLLRFFFLGPWDLYRQNSVFKPCLYQIGLDRFLE